jgi:hypothetical protein
VVATETVEIERRATGAVQISCGSAPAHRRPRLPYVVGQNGLSLIRGPNVLRSLEQRLGVPSSLRTTAAGCRALWPKLRLEATLTRCVLDAPVRGAVIRGLPWSTLDGTRVGDPLPRMRWQQPDARLVSTGRGESVWLLTKSHAPRSSRLYATVRSGRVAALTFSAR